MNYYIRSILGKWRGPYGWVDDPLSASKYPSERSAQHRIDNRLGLEGCVVVGVDRRVDEWVRAKRAVDEWAEKRRVLRAEEYRLRQLLPNHEWLRFGDTEYRLNTLKGGYAVESRPAVITENAMKYKVRNKGSGSYLCNNGNGLWYWSAYETVAFVFDSITAAEPILKLHFPQNQVEYVPVKEDNKVSVFVTKAMLDGVDEKMRVLTEERERLRSEFHRGLQELGQRIDVNKGWAVIRHEGKLYQLTLCQTGVDMVELEVKDV